MGWNEAVDAILSLKDLGVGALKIILKLLKSFPKFFSIFTYITDPIKIIKDIVYGIKAGFLMIFNYIYNNTVGRIVSLFVKDNVNGNNKDNKKGYTCLNNTFLELLLLVLSPPLVLFLRKGLTGISTVIICSVLTYFYYIPGLIYSSLYIL